MNANSISGHYGPISLPTDIQSGLDDFFTTVKDRLLCERPIEVEFPDATSRHWPAKKIEEMNAGTFGDLDGNGNLYAILAARANSTWMPKYVGTIACTELGKRIKEHLVDSNGPSSKLCEVKNEVSNGGRIAISYVGIKPENLREYMEKRIIRAERDLVAGRLSWNKRI